MKKSKIIANIYGYAVCLTAIIVFLISISQLIYALINLSDPLHAGWRDSDTPSLASYENYKADFLDSAQPKNQKSERYVPVDQTLRKMYRAAINEKIAYEQHRNIRDIYINVILLIISNVLFFYHWKWMRGTSRKKKKK